MRGPTVAPVIPSSRAPAVRGSSSSADRQVLPLPRLAHGERVSSVVYGLAAVDCHGRVADRVVLTALGWVSGTRVSIREDSGLIVVSADPHGVFALTRQGHLNLPAGVRRWCALVPGDRVLLAAEPDRATLVVHPPAALDAMVSRSHQAVFGGEVP